MANNANLTATEYANTFLLLLKNSLVAGRLVTGEFKKDLTDQNGLTVNVKRPPRFIPQNGEALALQSVVTGSTPVTVDTYKNVHIDYGDLESVQSVGKLLKSKVMLSAASALAHTIDGDIQDALVEFGSSVGTAGTDIATPQMFNKVHTRLMDQSVPNSDLNAIVRFDDGELIRGTLIGGNIDNVNRTALEKTKIPILSEIDLHASNNIRYITAGTRLQNTGPAVNGAAQNVNYRAVKDTNQQTFLMDGGGLAATYERGAVFTIAGVYATNAASGQVLPYLKQFVVLAAATADGAGAVSLTIAPAIVVPGTNDGFDTITNTAFQTVSAAPADGAAIVFTTAPASIVPIRAAFNRGAISLVSAQLRQPFTGVSAFVSDPETGIGIRYWRGSDISTGRHIHRWDCIYGIQNIQRELGARVSGT